MLWVSLIKEALKKSNKQYYEELYVYCKGKNKKVKPFCLSTFIMDYKIERDMFWVKDRVVLNITTPDYECGINLYNGLLNIKNFKYKEFELEKIKITLCKEKFINSEKAVFKTQSPVFIKDVNNNPLAPSDSEYVNELNFILNKELESNRGYGLKKQLEFAEIKMKKIVVKEEIREFSETTNKKNYYVNAYAGIFCLKGDIEDLNYIYQSGLGFRRSQGFGMVELISE